MERNDPRVQDMELPLPSGINGEATGEQNYATLRENWIAAEGAKGEVVEVPEDQEESLKLLIVDKPSTRALKHAVPLQSLMDKLSDQWIEDKTM